MEPVTVAAAAALLVASAASVLVVCHRARWLHRRSGRKVIVHTTNDQTLQGVLVASTTDGLVLRAATYLDEEPTALAGEVFVPRDRVFFIQVPA